MASCPFTRLVAVPLDGQLRPLGPGAGARPGALESVRKTHAAVIVDEGTRSGSLSAEISARIMEGGFYDLDAPVERVCSAEVPMRYAKHLEDAALPQPATIAHAARDVMHARGGAT